jgi:small conductance mechanosensitive channel
MPFHWTTDIFGDIRALLPLIVEHALSVIGAIAILLIGLWLAGRADKIVTRMAARTPHFDVMLRSFFGSLARYAVLTVTVLAVLSQFGIQTTSIVAVLGAAGLAVGLALQGTLSHLAAGVMLLIFRPFRIGDKVSVGGMLGTVKSLSLFWTELASDDNIQIIVPNGGVWGQPLKNFTSYPALPKGAEVRFRVPETIDIEAAAAAVQTALIGVPAILKDPKPVVMLDRSSADHLLEIVASFSAAEADIPAAKSDLIGAVHAAFGPILDKPPPAG